MIFMLTIRLSLDSMIYIILIGDTRRKISLVTPRHHESSSNILRREHIPDACLPLLSRELLEYEK